MKPVTTTTNQPQQIPITHSHLGKFNTVSGKEINLLNPCEDDIDIFDIAQALSNICRFGGHLNQFYSVAQHSVLVMAIVEPWNADLALEALLHDATEAYLGDVISPLKHLLGASYKTLEANFETVIAQKFLLNNSLAAKKMIKSADIQALEMEHAEFKLKQRVMPAIYQILSTIEDMPYAAATQSWPPFEAQNIFMTQFFRLTEKRMLKVTE